MSTSDSIPGVPFRPVTPEWYYLSDGRTVRGPFPAGQLRQWIQAGEVGPTSRISCDGRKWYPASWLGGDQGPNPAGAREWPLYMKPRLARWYLGSGVLLFALGVAAALATGRGVWTAGLGLAMAVAGLHWLRAPVVRLRPDHLAVKVSPLVRARRIRYQDIAAIDHTRPGRLVVHLRESGVSPVRLPVALLKPFDQGLLHKWLLLVSRPPQRPLARAS